MPHPCFEETLTNPSHRLRSAWSRQGYLHEDALLSHRCEKVEQPLRQPTSCSSIESKDHQCMLSHYAFGDCGDECSVHVDGMFTPPTMASASSWQTWLCAWEERQQLQLRQHEEATRELLEALRADLLERRLNKTQSKRSSAKSEKSEKSAFTLALPPGAKGVRISRNAAEECELRETKSEASGMDTTVDLEREISANSARTNGSPHTGGGGQVQWEASKSTASSAATPVNSRPTQMVGKIPSPSRRFRNRLNKPTHPLRRCIHDVVRSAVFAGCSSAMIALYTVAVGIMADTEMRAALLHEEAHPWLWYVDAFFTISFAIEVFLKLVAEGSFYFTCSDRAWNAFDMSVAIVGLSDFTTFMDINLGFIRVLRAFRAIRVLRVLRAFPIFKDLRLMAESICSCIVSLFWAIVLLFCVMYIFAVVLLRGASDSLRYNSLRAEFVSVLRIDFGNLFRTLFSLTQAVTGGRSWGEYAAPFVEISPWYAACFPLFIMFVILGAMNILTGIFVESTASIANFDKELAVEEEMARMEAVVTQIRDFFEELDRDGSGTLTQEELEVCIQDERVKAYFSLLEMNVSDAESLFNLLDVDGSGEVSIEEFIMNCMWLKGGARNMDLATMMRENQRLQTQVKKLTRSMDKQTKSLDHQISIVLNKINDTADNIAVATSTERF